MFKAIKVIITLSLMFLISGNLPPTIVGGALSFMVGLVAGHIVVQVVDGKL